MSLAKLLTTILSGIILLASIHFTNGTCPSGTTEGYAFCCCKKIFIENASLTVTIMPSTSIMPTASINLTSVNSTTIESTATTSYSLASTIVATSSLMNSINSTSTIEVSLLNTSATPALTSSVVATPTPIYRGDGCFITEQKYGYFNECYCNYTRYNYAGFNNSNGYYTKNPNSTSYNYKCWNLPKPKLHIGGLIETKQELGKKMLIAADLALEEINKNDLILPGYELVLLRQNSTEHFISTGSGVLLDYLNQSPKKVALLGPDDNDLAKTVAAIASLPRYKLLQVSYGTDAIELSLDHNSFYSYFFRTKPFLDLLYNKARVAMLEMFNWGKVGLLYSNDAYYSKLNANLRSQLQAKRISISIEEEFVTDPYSSLQHFQRKDVHVILGSFSGADASRVLCAAYKLKMYGPLYVYLFIGYTSLQAIDGCTIEQVKCAARYQFFFNSYVEPCTHNFVTNYTQRLNDTFFNTSVSPKASDNQLSYGKYIYDAVYVIANSLHDADTDKGNSSRFWLNFAYGSEFYGGKLRQKVVDYLKCGASGKVSFDEDGNRHYIINVKQIRLGGGDSTVGTFNNKLSSNKLQLTNVQWPGNNVPYREVTKVNKWRYISKGLYIAYCVFAALGILFALFCLFVLIWRRKHKEIRYSFYPLNIVIIIGCILVYISVFLFGIDNIISPVITVDRVCRARLWVFSIGFVLAVGGLIAKLWIVQDVLSRRILMEKKRRRIIMFGIVFAILVITLIILICWHTINPLKRVIEYIEEEVKFYCDTDIWPDNPFSIKITAVEQCKCANEIIWYFVIIIWKALLLFVAVYWAYQTREVFIPTINDTQRCGLCSYIIAACCVIGLIIALTTRLLPDVFFGLVGLIIIGCVTAVLIILFLHKILLVFSCSRNRIVGKSATEDDDDNNCFSRCLSKCCCGGAFCGCCTRCCKGNCPKCYLCLAACCAPFLLCCAPLLLCCSRLFACCGSSCRNCCCGSKSQRHGTNKAGEQKFIVKGVGDDKSAELARLQRELDMKNKYIEQMKGNDLPAVRRMWTQTTEPVVLLSDTCDDDSDDDGNDRSDGTGNKNGRKKRKKFRILNRKLDFSHVKSKTDSNYKDGKVHTETGTGTKNVPNCKDGMTDTNEKHGNLPVVYIDSGDPNKNDAEVARLKRLLAERDSEIDRLKYSKGKKNEFEMQEIDESIEKDMKEGLGFPAKDQNPQTIVIINPPKKEEELGTPKKGGKGEGEGDDKRKKTAGDDEDLDALIKELDTEETPRGSYDRNRSKFKIYNKKVDWSQIPSKLRAAGMIDQNGSAAPNAEKDKSPGKTNKISPEQKNTAGMSSSSLDPQANNARYSNNRRLSNIKIFHEKIDYSKIRSKIRPLLSNEPSKSSSSSSDAGSVRVLNAPPDYNKKVRNSTSNSSLDKPDAPRIGSNRTLNKPQAQTEPSVKPNPDFQSAANPEIKEDSIEFNGVNPPDQPKDLTEQPQSKADNLADLKLTAQPKSEINDSKDENQAESKPVSNPSPKPNPNIPPEPKMVDEPKTDVKILNDPKDYSHVKSKLIPDPPPKPNLDILAEPKTAAQRKKSEVRILNDPKNYNHVKSKLIPDPPPKPATDNPAAAKPIEKPKSDVRIVNDPKNYSHVKSKLVPDPPAKGNPENSGDASPREKPSPNVKIINAPQSYNHVKSKMPVVGAEPKKSSVKILNKPADYSHVKSKLP